MSQIPVLILILPLLFVPIIILMRMFKVSYLIVVVSSLLNFLLITILTLNVFTNGAVFYELGGWPPPVGIRLNADMLSCLFLMLIGFMNLVCIISCKEIVEKTVSSSKVYLFYTAWLLCNTGFTGIILTDDIFNMFVFLEISSLSSYYLISQGNQKKSTFAALQYLFIGSIGAIFVLFAIGLLYMITGTLNMQDLTKQLAVVEEKQILLFAIVFLLAGVGVKSALFPLHGWLIKTYAYSPSIVTTYFSGTSTKIGIYIFFRVFLDILNNISPLTLFSLSDILITLSSIGVVLITYYAIKQTDIKKMLAYSSVGQLSYIFIAMILYIPDGITASLVHVINHSIIKTSLFLTLTLLFITKKEVLLTDLAGLSTKQPIITSCFLIMSLALVGLPLTAGFISKWYLILSLIQSKYWMFTSIVVLTSFMTLFYVWKMIDQAYFKENSNGEMFELKKHQFIPIAFLTLLIIYLGVETSLTVGVSQSIAYDIIYGVI